MRTILITGGTGLVGQEITSQLLAKNYKVHILTRSPKPTTHPKLQQFKWDIGQQQLDTNCFNGVTDIIHLAGASIAQRWTTKAKQQIIDSRVDSANLLFRKAKEHNVQLQSYIGASASGIYKPNTAKTLTEEAELGSNFLTKSCILWEQASQQFNEIAKNVCINRIGIVLAKNGGALEKMLPPFQFGVSPYFGKGNQYYSCIHVKDVAKQFVFCLENSLNGVFNCSTEALTQQELNKAIAKALNKNVLQLPTPIVVIHTMLGEMSIILTDSLKMSSQKIKNKGFQPEFETVQDSLNEILR